MANNDAEIRFQFRQGPTHLPRRARYLFDGNMEDLLKTSVHHRQRWLASVTAARAMANEHQAQQDESMAASRQLMRAWLDGHHTGEG
jgi:hypothetical protein